MEAVWLSPHIPITSTTAHEHHNLDRVMVFNAAFNNISVILWWSVLMVEETGVPGENHRLVQVTDKLYHIMYTSSERDLNSQR